jgi:hypothetical protein
MNIWKNGKMEKVGQRPLAAGWGDREPRLIPASGALPEGEFEVTVHYIFREG